jgi:3-phenylpropionate/cinnamic acid dioxygenase small subunit
MPVPSPRISDAEFRAAHQFLVYEARLFDEHRYLEWLELLSEDIVYKLLAPTVQSATDAEREPAKVPLFSENLGSLRSRAEQLANPMFTVSENPPSRSRHFVTNIWVDKGPGVGELVVSSNVLIYRGRGFDLPQHYFPVARSDLLRTVDGELRLAVRTAECDEQIIGSRSITLLV